MATVACGPQFRWRVAIGILGFVGLAALVWERVRQFSPSPSVSLTSSLTTHLGEGRPNESLATDFWIVNSGLSELVFKIGASCGCTELRPRRGVVAPGARISIHAAVRLGQRGADRSVRLSIETNDPIRPTIERVLVASCPRLLSVAPSILSFGSVLQGESASLLLRIQSHVSTSVASSPRILLRSHSPFVSAAFQGDDHSEALVVVSPDAPSGHFLSHVDVSISIGDLNDTVTVPVTVDIGGNLLIVPRTLVLPEMLSQGSQHIFVWPVDPILSLGEWDASLPDGYTLVELPLAGRRRHFLLSIAANARERPDAITIRFPQVGESVAMAIATTSARGGEDSHRDSPGESTMPYDQSMSIPAPLLSVPVNGEK